MLAKLTPEKCDRFLELYEETQSTKRAAKSIGVTDTAFYNLRAHDPEFDARWKQVLARVRAKRLSMMEDEAYRRAHDGVTEGIYHQGQLIAKQKKYSDVLLMFLMKAEDPRYRDHRSVSGPDGGPVQMQMENTSQSQGAIERLVTFLENLIGDNDEGPATGTAAGEGALEDTEPAA